LRAGLASGAINALCSDHTPVDDDGKQMPFDEAEVGATGLELLLPLTLKWAQEMKLPLPRRWPASPPIRRASSASRPAAWRSGRLPTSVSSIRWRE
jgi:dihydroorotase-like cyclic amidohydrolase